MFSISVFTRFTLANAPSWSINNHQDQAVVVPAVPLNNLELVNLFLPTTQPKHSYHILSCCGPRDGTWTTFFYTIEDTTIGAALTLTCGRVRIQLAVKAGHLAILNTLLEAGAHIGLPQGLWLLPL
jgi:hypothetical protein